MAATSAFEIELLTTQYTSTVQLLLQQMDSRLRGAVLSGSHVGKMASPVQYIGALQFKQAGDRGSPLVPQTAQYQRRWVFPKDDDLTVQVDTFDELRTIVDPRSPLTAAVSAAGARLFDDLILAAMFSTAQTGVDSSSLTTETFNSGADFPIDVTVADTFKTGAETGLTVAKIIEGRRILRKYHNDLEAMTVHIAISAQQEADLLNQVEVISTEYSSRPRLEEGRIRSFMGCEFHYSERLPFNPADTDERYVPMWVQDGMYLGLWKDMQTVISQRNDLVGHLWQAYTMVSANATRLQGGKLVRISCLDTSGADITV
jgi:hypothetical protein